MKLDNLLVLIAATLLTITTTVANQMLLPLIQQDAVAQNATATNQTNQTQAALSALTQTDLESVADDLAAATDALQANDTTEAYNAVNSIDHDLFDTVNDQGEQNIKPLMEIFKPLQDNIDSARDALRNNDTANALQLLNSTDAELLKITPQLPAEE
jgi:molecular chaperone GrpE (heat shock protein)